MSRSIELGHVDLNLLYTFRVVVDSGGVGAAARVLRRSQPAISGRLRQLENHLGVKLVERAGRKLALTTPGRAVEQAARQLTANIQGVLDQVDAAKAHPVGVLRLGALPTVSVYLLAPAVVRFCERHERAGIDLHLGLTGEQMPLLQQGRLDLLASVGPLPKGDLDVSVIGETQAVAVMPRRHELASRRRLSIGDLRRSPLIGFGKVGDQFFDRVEAFLREHELERQTRLRVPHIQSIQSLVLAGAGIGILPGYTVLGPDVVARPVQGLDLRHPIWIAVRPTNRHVPLVSRFIDEVTTVMQRSRRIHQRSR